MFFLQWASLEAVHNEGDLGLVRNEGDLGLVPGGCPQ